jgi:quercetin dioxygenase-like cupin family protein
MERRMDAPLDEPLNDGELELAALYALSALAPGELEALERDFRERRAFWAEVRSLRDAAAGLAESGPRARPRRDLWPDIRARIARSPTPGASASQPWKQWPATPSAPADGPVLAGAAGEFEPTHIEGIAVRRLSVDPVGDRVTMLVRMAAGTAYPAHRHGGAEECYVLEGDLSIGDSTHMKAGDFQRMDRGSVHAVQSTRGGCLLLITSSRHDELLN